MNILMTFSHFAVSIPRYFLEAFRRNGHKVYTAGPAFANWIPWTPEGARTEGMTLPVKYNLEPDIRLDSGFTYTWDMILEKSPVKIDFVLNHAVPAGHYSYSIIGRPRGVKYGLLLTDPHVLEWHYKTVRYDADFVFNMQDCYKQEGDYYIPYAYDPETHYLNDANKDLDAVCIGLQYPNRKLVMDELSYLGRTVVSQVGLAFDEYRAIHNRAKVAFSWSSKQDTIARVFEAPRMGCALVCNNTPDLFKFFNPDEITVFRADVREAVSTVEQLLDDDDMRSEMMMLGYRAVEAHTYDHRAQMITGIVEKGIKAADHNRSLGVWIEGLKANRASS